MGGRAKLGARKTQPEGGDQGRAARLERVAR